MAKISHTQINPKPYTLYGVKHASVETQNTYNADIEPGESIRIYGLYANRIGGPVAFDKTFKVGDWAEYDSYNLIYCGIITAIGEKTVTILGEYGRKATRLDLHSFCRRNWDFNLEEIARRNSEWTD